MKCDAVRCHLTPSDFTDDKGNLVETVYLDLLDYMIAEASKRGIYVNISFLNNMSFDLPYEDPWDHTHFTVEHSFMAKDNHISLLFDRDVVEASKNFVKQLLNRRNPYLDIPYKLTPAVAVWEVITKDLPEFKEMIIRILNEEFQILIK